MQDSKKSLKEKILIQVIPDWYDFAVCFCSDFRYESNRIFVLGLIFFSSDKFRIFNYPFLTEFSYIIQKVLLPFEWYKKIWKDISPAIFFVSYGGLKIAILANLGQLTRHIFRAIST